MATAAEALSGAGSAAGGGTGSGTPGGGAGTAGGGGTGAAATGATPWFASLVPESDTETRQWLGNKNFPDPKTAFTTARNLEREAATLRAAKPGYPVETTKPDGTIVKPDDAAWKVWRETTGVPEAPDKYELPSPANNPYPEYMTEMAKAMHELGVPKAMGQKLAAMQETVVAALETKIQAAEKAKSEQGLLEWQNELGPKFTEQLALANRGKAWLAERAGGLTDAQVSAFESLIGTKAMMSAFAALGAGNSEARFAGSDNGRGNTFGNSVSDAQARLEQATAQRAAGKMNDHEWREFSKKGGELESLTERIAAGMGK
jgi:hypothetical protein